MSFENRLHSHKFSSQLANAFNLTKQVKVMCKMLVYSPEIGGTARTDLCPTFFHAGTKVLPPNSSKIYFLMEAECMSCSADSIATRREPHLPRLLAFYTLVHLATKYTIMLVGVNQFYDSQLVRILQEFTRSWWARSTTPTGGTRSTTLPSWSGKIHRISWEARGIVCFSHV